MHLGIVDCKWSVFNDWSECSKSCGWGVKTSERKIIEASSHGGKDCVGKAKRTEKCNNQPCAGIRKLISNKKIFIRDKIVRPIILQS